MDVIILCVVVWRLSCIYISRWFDLQFALLGLLLCLRVGIIFDNI